MHAPGSGTSPLADQVAATTGARARPSVALVLGAGNALGAAFHIGALAALAEVTGWDARDADLVVGTSAGSLVAATLRGGLSPADRYALSQGEALSPAGAALPLAPVATGLPPRGPRPAAWLRPTAPWLSLPALWPGRVMRLGLLAGLLPRGQVDPAVLGNRARRLNPGRWPARPTWICATRLRDGARVVFGRDDVDVPDLGVAVSASSAVASAFAPVRIDGHDYADGALHSATNADLTARLGFDLVIVSSPMSGTRHSIGLAVPGSTQSVHGVWRQLSPAAASRRFHAWTLADEVRRIRAGGTPVLVLQPNEEDLDVMGVDLRDRSRMKRLTAQARSSVASHLEDRSIADRVAILHG